MKISNSNDYPNAFSAFSVTSDADGDQDVEDITTGDFSTRYTSAGSNTNFTISKTFSSVFDCEYVAIAGHTFGSSNGGSVEIRVNTVLKDTIVYAAGTRNDVLMSHFDSVSCTTIEIKFIKNTSSDRITISYVSAGEILSLVTSVNDEGAGFPRGWLTDSKKIRSMINDAAEPVAYIRQSISRKVTLNIKNVGISITNSQGWLDLLDRIYENGDFFLKEEDGDTTGISDNPKTTSMCFNAEMMPPKAHGATRQLNNVSIRYNALVGH